MAEPFPVRIVRYMLILAAICASPAYAVWIAGGAIADKFGQRRNR
jgi:nitrate/nitrite transporter NarK